jgi:hypothetical protein
MSHNSTVSPGLITLQAAPFRPTPKLLAAWAPSPGAPLGFSNDIDRDTSPVTRLNGWLITSGGSAITVDAIKTITPVAK